MTPDSEVLRCPRLALQILIQEKNYNIPIAFWSGGTSEFGLFHAQPYVISIALCLVFNVVLNPSESMSLDLNLSSAIYQLGDLGQIHIFEPQFHRLHNEVMMISCSEGCWRIK